MPKDHKQHEKYLKLKKINKKRYQSKWVNMNINVKNTIKKWISITIVKLANDQEMMLLDHWMLLCE